MGTWISMYAEIERNGTWHLLTELDENSQEDEIYYGRQNYRLFAILADIRNPSAWGMVDGKPFTFDFIDSIRGLPQDLSPELYDLTRDEDGTDIGSSSWLLLAEVLEFDWHGKVMVHEDWVDPALADLFEQSQPYPFDKLPQLMNYDPDAEDGVIVRWTETYAESAEDFMEFLEKLKQYGDPSQIRLVFCFDH